MSRAVSHDSILLATEPSSGASDPDLHREPTSRSLEGATYQRLVNRLPPAQPAKSLSEEPGQA